ncbi:MAG TPA: hypothetical protein PKY22_02185 [Accumulibacter sp.]|nr:hypothetical protein [Accumulibacter sp.]
MSSNSTQQSTVPASSSALPAELSERLPVPLPDAVPVAIARDASERAEREKAARS